ncbi:NAD-dependent epimerase/dehydratase family protein [Microlunatus flavus]|uniref:Nucleoside-diphosphate-sugar epimerase n=1 Tax=Microlunatus flavus TaxID=1036181 RepID=A0A1H9G5W4_9ACTN|nr:NAD-dependent epimerase/dehydratase family protein [Microlunatus flavus]SEQ45489.1 Nucleoside-diphosphate-sugar epimerase [Microlunatus flavus]
MRIYVLGATGHIGSYLVPRLVRAGHEVVAASRGTREAYHPDPAWDDARRVVLDRDASDAEGTTAAQVLAERPDAVVDLVCFTPDSARQLVEGLRGEVGLLAHCGSIWSHGLSTSLPMEEDDPKHPFGEYGVGKQAIEDLLLAESASSGGLPCTVVHPGHISGPGWRVINPVGNVDPRVWATIARGEELTVPGDASATMHHVHADDVAQVFELALQRPEASVGEAFHAVSARALTVRGFAEAAYAWWGHEARLRPVTWEQFRAEAGDEHAGTSWEHLHRSQVCSISKPQSRLGYEPGWTSDAAAHEAVAWLAAHDEEHDLPAPA